MSFGGVDDHLDPERVTRTFVRVRRGYDPPAVDAHLAVIRDGVEKLHQALEADQPAEGESLDLVLEATRRSIDDALTEAQATAATKVAEAEATAAAKVAEAEATAAAKVAEAEATAAAKVAQAEAAASARVVEAESEAREVVGAAQTRARRQDETARERYVELGRLLEVRQTELLALDQQIADRQQVLRRAAQELRSLADGMPSPESAPRGETGANPDTDPARDPTPNGDVGPGIGDVGADHQELRVPEGVELHFPEQVGSDA